MRAPFVACVLVATTAVFACVEYKPEPENGKQACAVGPKQCPDDYKCIDGVCCKDGICPAGSVGGSLPASSAVVGGAGGNIPVTTSVPPASGGVGGSSARVGGITTVPNGGAGSKAVTGSSVTGGSVTATFRNGQAVGPITGFGWIAMGPMDIVTDPTCGATNTLITQSRPCADITNWNSASALCLSGTIPALPLNPVKADFDDNWGVQIGVNAREEISGTLLKSYSALSAKVTGAPAQGFRLMLHRKGDPDGTVYCYDAVSSGESISLRLFNTKCWGDATTVYLQDADVPVIDRLGVQINSTQSTITLSNLCLNSFTFVE